MYCARSRRFEWWAATDLDRYGGIGAGSVPGSNARCGDCELGSSPGGVRESSSCTILAGPTVAIVAMAAKTVRVAPTRAMGMDGLCSVEFLDASAILVPVSNQSAWDLLSLSRLCYAARAWGAADRAFELVIPYVKERKQFGQPVGRFQAIQHKIANNLIALMGVQLSLDNAALHFDRGIGDWRTFSAAAFAYSNATLRQVS